MNRFDEEWTKIGKQKKNNCQVIQTTRLRIRVKPSDLPILAR